MFLRFMDAICFCLERRQSELVRENENEVDMHTDLLIGKFEYITHIYLNGICIENLFLGLTKQSMMP